MKKIALIVLTIILACAAVLAVHADECVITVENVIADADASAVDASVTLSGNTDIMGMLLQLSFDDELTLTALSKGDALKTLYFSKPGKFISPCGLLWDGQEADSSNGTLITLTFTLPENPAGKYDISLSYTPGKIYDSGFNDVFPRIVNGGITVVSIDGKMPGAQLRVDGIRGLRFGTKINFNAFMPDLNNAVGVTHVSYGTLVVPTAFLTESGLDENDLIHEISDDVLIADVKAENILEYSQGESAVFTAVVTDIPDDAKRFTARGYVKYSTDNGSTFIYHYFLPITRSIDDVKQNAGW